MTTFLSGWPPWVGQFAWTALTVGIAYGIGHLLRASVGARLVRVASGTAPQWDDAVTVVAGRLPFWSLLGGAFFSLRYWSLGAEDHVHAVTILSALAVASFTYAFAAVAAGLVSAYGPRATPGAPVSALIQNTVRGLVIILGALVVMRSLGYEIAPYLTALGVGGLGVALALQDPLSNFFAGVFLGVSGQIRIGDCVRLDGGIEGYVTDFNWRAASIRMLSNSIVIVPNAKLAQATVTNFHLPSPDLAVSVDVGVHYSSDLTAVERVTIEVAREVIAQVPGVVSDIEPVVRFHTFGPVSIVCSVIVRGQEYSDQFLIKHELVKRLQARYAREGIVLPFSPLETRLPSGAVGSAGIGPRVS